MGVKTSVVPQMDFLLPTKFKKCHRPTKLTGQKNIEAYDSLCEHGLHGITAEELATERHWILSTAGSCLVELRWLKLARKTDAQRNGKSIYIAIKEAERD